MTPKKSIPPSQSVFLKEVVTGFVDHPEDVVVSEIPSEDGSTTLNLSVNQEDMGKVIGKGGKIAKALRLLVRIPALRENQRVSLEITELPVS